MADHLNVRSYPLLLQALSSDEEAAASEFFKLRNSLVRFFQLKGDGDPEQAADETLDRVSAKVSERVKIIDLTKYSFGVARLVFLEDVRKSQRSAKALRAYGLESERFNPAEEADGFASMRDCFSELSESDKDLLTSYFADLPRRQLDEMRQRLASSLNASQNNLRLKIFRLRRRLEDCVRTKT